MARIAPKTDADCYGRGRRRPAPATTEASVPSDDGKKIYLFLKTMFCIFLLC